MSKALQPAGELTADQINTLALAGVIPKDTPPAMLSVFATTCKEHGLSPFRKEIYLIFIGGKHVTVVGIEGSRKKAARTGQYAGIDDAKYDLAADGSFRSAAELKSLAKTPTSCTVSVYRIVCGLKCQYTATVIFDEFAAPQRNAKWREMPFQMIKKVAEMNALKEAFGDELGGLHIEEEAAAFEGTTAEAIKYQAVDPLAIEPELSEQAEDVKAYLDSFDALPKLVEYYTGFSQTVHGQHKGFIQMFIVRGCELSNTVAELEGFYKTVIAWKAVPALMKPITERKKALENALPPA